MYRPRRGNSSSGGQQGGGGGRLKGVINGLLNRPPEENQDFKSGQNTQDIQSNIIASGGSAEDYPMLQQEQSALNQGPFNRAPWYSRMFGGGQQADAANTQYLLTKNLMPLENQQFATQQGIVSQEDLKRQQQTEDFKSLLQGQSLSQLASGGAIPYSGNIYGSNYQDIARNWNALTGSFGQQGALAGVPAAQAGAASSEYGRNLTQGGIPFANELGAAQGRNAIAQQNIQANFAQPEAQNRLALGQESLRSAQINNASSQSNSDLLRAINEGSFPYAKNLGATRSSAEIMRDLVSMRYAQPMAQANLDTAQGPASQGLLTKDINNAKMPFASDLGASEASSNIAANRANATAAEPEMVNRLRLGQARAQTEESAANFADEEARAKLGLIKANTLANSYIPQGFHLNQSTGLPDIYAAAPQHFQQTTTEHETMIDPKTGKEIILPTLRPVTKPYAVGMSVKNVPLPVTAAELSAINGQPSSQLQPVNTNAALPNVMGQPAQLTDEEVIKKLMELIKQGNSKKAVKQ